MRRLELSPDADADMVGILATSRKRHGIAAAERDDRLPRLSFRDLAEQPKRPSTKAAGAGGIFLYPLRSTAKRLTGYDAVRAPPHVVAYRFGDERIVILRVFHEAMDIPTHLQRLT